MNAQKINQQGLYHPQFEHDACGVGFVVQINGKKSHKIVEHGLTILANLAHRGATGAESNTGDGAGILTQIPHPFFKKVCTFTLPEEQSYGVGMVFLPQEENPRQKCEKILEEIIASEGQTFLGSRTIPTHNNTIGPSAKDCEPMMKQIFIGRSPQIKDDLTFERKLYIIRKLTESKIRYAKQPFSKSDYFYIASLSCRTIIYKGMLTPNQVSAYYPDLSDPDFTSAIALVHSRFSTNTFPSWERAHPNRYIIHNGEINTLRGNINWMKARENLISSEIFGKDLAKIKPIILEDGSDSSIFDNCFEFLVLAGRSMAETAMMMIPEPWEKHKSMDPKKKAFYEFNSGFMEPWDGPASIGFTDGISVGAILDRNGLRPSRYYVTKDNLVVMASEAGVLDIAPSQILKKGRLEPGKMFLINTQEGKIISDEELKQSIVSNKPYEEWLDKNRLKLTNIPNPLTRPAKVQNLMQYQKAFGYTYEDIHIILSDTVTTEIEPIGAMGNDAPLAVLSDKPQLLYNYFRQLFAQVTNPPIDAIREELITSSLTLLGTEGNLLHPDENMCKRIQLDSPILKPTEFEKLCQINHKDYKIKTLPILFDSTKGEVGLTTALNNLFESAQKAIQEGTNLLVLSDKMISAEKTPIPALLAVAGLHHNLIKNGLRTKASIILESGEPRSVHHFALLVGYGVTAIYPYLAFESIEELITNEFIKNIPLQKAFETYVKASTKGVIKVMSKMGISTIQSYRGAQIFEAVGIDPSVIDLYFTGTISRIKGINLEIIVKEADLRHQEAFPARPKQNPTLDSGGEFKWRYNGEYHAINPQIIHKIQSACRNEDYQAYKEYAKLTYNPKEHLSVLRDLFSFTNNQPIPIDQVESIDSIIKRFKTGAMSFGSISQEVHETMAIAMNRIGAKSNTGEGGEDPARFSPLPNGDSKCSAIKQVASGRFGVTSEYLVSAKEIQIKMAQGAKPGEGGQLPGKKVYPWIAKVRHSTPGVGLISPPPHHDIYSIEDLAQLIHDLKNANSKARISVKLVSEMGVGTIAAGVAKGHAEVVLISGGDGGTGASPRTSIKHAGLPWELGLSETHQTLLLNNLRNRIAVETDGQLKTGRDVAIAALLGAEEFGFGTMPLVVLGCVMMRFCNLDTCPVGIATQNPELRACFTGKPEHLINFMKFVAQDLREIMAQLGFKSIEEMIGRTDKLQFNPEITHWKAKKVDISPILYQPQLPAEVGKFCQISQDHGLTQTLDHQQLLNLCQNAITKGEPINATIPIRNIHRDIGTLLGCEITQKYGGAGLPENSIQLHLKGSAGQSFGAFIPKGITLELEGDANDYLGKGLSGGKIIVFQPRSATFSADQNILIGNVAFYGATNGKAYISGLAGERFCVRNSGVHAVVEGVGDHGCEYMTGGRVIILGPTGRNFAAGMSGGFAYILDETDDFTQKCNLEMVELTTFKDESEENEIHEEIVKHVALTQSKKGQYVLDHWTKLKSKFIKIFPIDYRRILENRERCV